MSKRYILIGEETGEKTGITLEAEEIAILDKHVEHMVEFEKTLILNPMGWTRLHVLAVVAVKYGIERLWKEYETPGAATPRESR